MRAAVMAGFNQPLEVRTVPDPQPSAEQLLIEVGRCGICGSDLHMNEDPTFGQGPGSVFGHEFAGEIVEVGRNVEGFARGELVAVSPLQSCGHCEWCRRGEVQWCAEFGLQGGGYAQFALTRPNQCVKLPSALSLADGAIVEPLAVALHGVRCGDLEIGDKVVVIGAGPIGLAVAFWARRRGAGRVVVKDIHDGQRQLALQMGAHAFVIGDNAEVERELGGKADIVFECAGVPGVIDQAAGLVRNRGAIVLLGLCTKPDSINTFAMLGKEVRLVTSAFFRQQEFEAALDALAMGAIEPRALVTGTVSLDQTPEMFESLKRRSGHCKVLIAPD